MRTTVAVNITKSCKNSLTRKGSRFAKEFIIFLNIRECLGWSDSHLALRCSLHLCAFARDECTILEYVRMSTFLHSPPAMIVLGAG